MVLVNKLRWHCSQGLPKASIFPTASRDQPQLIYLQHEDVFLRLLRMLTSVLSSTGHS